MKRRQFIVQSGLVAMSMSAFGSVSWNGKEFVGDTPTTSDILGPFYRPGSPLRTNLIPPDSNMPIMELSGTIYDEDGVTVLPNVLIESWQCDENEKYDNISNEYILRGSQKTNENGQYNFRTIIPIPYQDEVVGWRPAHIHLRISSPDRQDLITQVYFKNDPYISSDPSANSSESQNRILELQQTSTGETQVEFNIVLGQSYSLDDAGYQKITGLYQVEQGLVEYYREDDLLFAKLNGQILEGFVYQGNNTFVGGHKMNSVRFEFSLDGSTKAHITYWENWPGVEGFPMKMEGITAFNYGH